MQVVLSGAMRGLAIGVFAVGIILIYRSNRVFNFALGELGALAAASSCGSRSTTTGTSTPP